MAKRGRKSLYEELVEPRLEEIKWWCREGATMNDLAQRLGLSTTSLNTMMGAYPELALMIKRGKAYADYIVEDACFSRATGYEYDEITRERIPYVEIKKDPKTGRMKTHKGYRLEITKVVTKQVIPDVLAQIWWLKNRKRAYWRDKVDIASDQKFECKIILPEDFPEQLPCDAQADSQKAEEPSDDGN